MPAIGPPFSIENESERERLRQRSVTKEAHKNEALLSAPLGGSAPGRRTHKGTPNRGSRERQTPLQVASLSSGRGSTCRCEYGVSEKGRISRLCKQSGIARSKASDCHARRNRMKRKARFRYVSDKRRSFSQLRLSNYRRKTKCCEEYLEEDSTNVLVNASQHYEALIRLAMANKRRISCAISACISTEDSKTLVNTRNCNNTSVGKPCITAGKIVPLQRVWCGHRRTPFRE
jgi:hypothetical protein